MSGLLGVLGFVPLVMGVGNASNAALKAIERPSAVFYAYLASAAVTFFAGIPLVVHRGLKGAVDGMLLSAAAYTLTLLTMWIGFLRRKGPIPLERGGAPLRVAIIEPIWTGYRHHVYRELSEHCCVDWIFSPAEREAGFGKVAAPGSVSLRYIELPMRRPFGERLGFLQMGVVRYLILEQPDVIMFSADPRSLSFWITLILGRVLGIPVYAHGHGVFKKDQISWFYRRMMNFVLRFSAGYIAYAPLVRDSFARHGFPLAKVHVADNSLVNPFPLRPDEKTGDERGVLFLGRLRQGCGVGVLLKVVKQLREQEQLDIEIHIIGGGDEELRLRNESTLQPWIHWHGEIHDPIKIRDISRACFVGCYPGNAGLSVVHLMSLSLPVVVHNRIQSHQGPEPGFIRNGENGLLFDPERGHEEIYRSVYLLATKKDLVAKLQTSASRDYTTMTNPSLALRLWKILAVDTLTVTRELGFFDHGPTPQIHQTRVR